MRTVELLETVPEVRDHYRTRFLHILVDEFQDTNTAQNRLLELLLDKHKNLCVVGDDDQSIYAWRGAKIENILGFQRVFPKAAKVVLGRNYRSTSNILAVADAVIRHNRSRVKKDLKTDNEAGRKVHLFRADDEYDEARFVADRIRELFLKQGVRRSGIAVFYRINALSRVFEEELLRRGLPFVVVGGTRFYDRKEIKDVLAYLRLAVNPTDDVSAKRIVNVPPRKIGKVTVEKISALAQSQALSFLQAAGRIIEENTLAAGAKTAVAGFLKIVEEIVRETESLQPPQALEQAMERSGYLGMLAEDRTVEGLSRKENLGELVEAVSQFHDRNPEATLADFLEQVSLTQDADLVRDEEDCVRLMTLHNAKGLEFPAVFMVGVEEAILPPERSVNDGESGVEEERRLCYVGITRSRQFLTLSCAARRRSFSGSSSWTRPSRFLDEIPEDLVEPQGYFFPKRGPGKKAGAAASARSIRGRRRAERPVEVPAGEVFYDYSESQLEDGAGGLFPGRNVMHPKFGAGKILAASGTGDRAKVTVRFASVGVKTMLLQYANLELQAP